MSILQVMVVGASTSETVLESSQFSAGVVAVSPVALSHEIPIGPSCVSPEPSSRKLTNVRQRRVGEGHDTSSGGLVVALVGAIDRLHRLVGLTGVAVSIWWRHLVDGVVAGRKFGYTHLSDGVVLITIAVVVHALAIVGEDRPGVRGERVSSLGTPLLDLDRTNRRCICRKERVPIARARLAGKGSSPPCKAIRGRTMRPSSPWRPRR